MPPESRPSPYLTLQIPDGNTVTSFESSFWEIAESSSDRDKPPLWSWHAGKISDNTGPWGRGGFSRTSPGFLANSPLQTAFLSSPLDPHPQALAASEPSSTPGRAGPGGQLATAGTEQEYMLSTSLLPRMPAFVHRLFPVLFDVESTNKIVRYLKCAMG